MKRVIELHDSRVLGFGWDRAVVVIALDAYVHASKGTPGRDAGTGWSQRVELRVGGPAKIEEGSAVPLWITDGFIEVGRVRTQLVPLPFESSEPIRLEFIGAAGRLVVSGDTGIMVLPRGEATFVEDVPGH